MSADVAVPEHARELEFYSSVLTTGDIPLWRHDLMNNAGKPIIGLGERSPEYAELPLQWMPHIQVADVSASVECALALGGREVMHQKNDRGASQWAVLCDPVGAAFGVIPAVDSEATAIGSGGSFDPVGRIARLDLTVDDAASARDFYRDVVGWSVRDVEREDERGQHVDYELCQPDGSGAVGVVHARRAHPDLPPVWMIGLPVGDLDESLKRVREGGGEIIEARKGSTGTHVYSVVRDPAGLYMALTVPSSR